MQAMELEDDLKSTLEAFDVEVLKGRDYVQVRSNAVNKGVLVTQVLETLRRSYNAEVDLVICLGDDTTDEAMWKRGNRVRRRFEAATQYVEDKEAGVKREAVGEERGWDVGDLHGGKEAVEGTVLCE